MNYLKLEPNYESIEKRFKTALKKLSFKHIRDFGSPGETDILADRIKITRQSVPSNRFANLNGVAYRFHDAEQGNILVLKALYDKTDKRFHLHVTARECRVEERKQEYDLIIKCLLEWIKENTTKEDEVVYIYNENKGTMSYSVGHALQVQMKGIDKDGFTMAILRHEGRYYARKTSAIVKVRLKDDRVITTVSKANNHPYPGLYQFEIDTINATVRDGLLRNMTMIQKDTVFETIYRVATIIGLKGLHNVKLARERYMTQLKAEQEYMAQHINPASHFNRVVYMDTSSGIPQWR